MCIEMKNEKGENVDISGSNYHKQEDQINLIFI